MGAKKYDFGGWATKNNLRCSDGRVIIKDAFKDQNGVVVPLVWNHDHNNPSNVLGHALLQNRDEGVYAYCSFNDSESGRNAKRLVNHGDVVSLSIYANQLKQQGSNVLHGAIREVSLVLAGANPGALIDAVLAHGEASNEEAIIFTGDEDLYIAHRYEDDDDEAEYDEDEDDEDEDDEDEDDEDEDDEDEEDVSHSSLMHSKEEKAMAKEKTVQDVFDELTEEQKQVVYAIIGMALEDAGAGQGEDMKHNVFDNDFENDDNYISHSEMEAIFSDAKRGTLADAVLAHGITNIDYLFPDYKSVTNPPTWVNTDTKWVQDVMGSVHHTPFSRIKSSAADITEDEARAKGYIKGNEKLEQIFELTRRTTDPQTVYKKQKLDRDDVIDITDFDVVAWIKSEMRMKLDEELARAFLIGDGRLSGAEDHISHDHIRPIWTDSDFYTIKQTVTVTASMSDDAKAKAYIRAAVKSRKNYKGSGNPTLYTTEDVLTDMLLIEDSTGRVIYDSVEKLCNQLRVKKIVTVPQMENQSRTVDGKTHKLVGIIVNLADYYVGADKGGAVNMFDDFDIDYNAQKYLIETRCSGALVFPYSAIALESVLGE